LNKNARFQKRERPALRMLLCFFYYELCCRASLFSLHYFAIGKRLNVVSYNWALNKITTRRFHFLLQFSLLKSMGYFKSKISLIGNFVIELLCISFGHFCMAQAISKI